MTKARKPNPAPMQMTGAELYAWATGEFEHEPHEMVGLIELVRIKDRLDALNAAIERDGVMVPTVAGEKPNPALVEARQQAIAFFRGWAAMRYPSGDEDAGRPQRRSGARGTYGVGGGGTSRLRRVS